MQRLPIKKTYIFFSGSAFGAWQAYIFMRFLMMLSLGVCLAKLGFSKTYIALFETFLLVLVAGSSFWVNGCFQTLAGENFQGKTTLRTIFWTMSGYAAMAALLFYALHDWIFSFWHVEESGNITLWLCLWFLTYPVSLLLEYAWMIEKKSRMLWLSVFGLQPLIPIFLVGSAYTGNPEAIVRGFVFLGCIRWTLLLAYVQPWREAPRWQKGTLPLLLVGILTGYAPHLDAGFVRRFVPDQLAIFQYGAKELPLSVMLMAALSESMAPFTRVKDDLLALRARVKRYLWPLFIFSIGLMWTAPFLFRLVFSPDFVQSAGIFQIFLLLLIPRMWMPQVWFLGTGQRKKILLAAGIDTLLNVSISLALFPFLGIQGLAWGTVVAFSVEKILLTLWLRREGIGLGELIPLKSWAIGSLLLVISYLFAS